MRDLLVMLIVLGSIPAIFLRPWLGIIVWCWIGFMNPHRMAWGFAYEFPFAMLIGLVTILALVFNKETKDFQKTSLTGVWLLWIVWMNLSTVFAYDFGVSVLEWERTMKIQLFVALTAILINDKERLRWLLWITIFSIGFFGVKGGIFAIATGGAHRVYGPSGGFFADNNAVGLALVMTVPLMWYMRNEFKSKWLRLSYMGAVGLAMLAILATHSRGAFLAVAAIVGFLWLKSRNKLILGVVLLAAGVTMLGMMPEHWWDRMASIRDYKEDGSAMGRINAWWYAYYYALDHPLFGGGFNSFRKELFLSYAPVPDQFHDAHSVYFEVLGEHGFVGLAIFLALWLVAFLTAGSVIRTSKRHPSLQWAADLSRMCQVSILGYAVGGAFLGLAYFDLYYHVVAIIVIIRGIVTREVLELERAPGPVPRPGVRKPAGRPARVAAASRPVRLADRYSRAEAGAVSRK